MPSEKKKIFVTRRVPQPGLDLLKDHDVEIYEDDEAIPREVLLEKVKGVHALFCLLTDPIDSAVLEAAGKTHVTHGTC